MSSFGGSIKLTGEADYRRALKQITADLKSTSQALKAQATDFNNDSKSMQNTAEKSKALSRSIEEQKNAIASAQRSYNQYSVSLQAQQTRHQALSKEYKKAVLELDRIKEECGETSDEYKKQAQRVAELEGAMVESTDEMDKSKRAMSALKSEINQAQRTMDSAEKEVSELGDETEDSGKKAEKAKDGFTVFKGALANLAAQGVTAAINGLKKLGSTLIDVGKQSLQSYAEYEQLVGGVETLFKDSAPVVQEYADNAFKTAQISANDYMETVTSFSASLLQGLNGDTAKAAKIADMAIIDMSDNANKMGTDMSMIEHAYQGFAKQNFTMLDNLKLGYGGSAGEMARLINKTGVMGKAFKATAKNVKEVPFDKMIEAIHKVQVEMGITGTSAKEASGTIEGSTKSMQAAWKNLLRAIADDNADISKSIDLFTKNAIGAAKNLAPRIVQIVQGMKKTLESVINETFPKLKREIPQLKPLIETFEWFIKNKQLVVTAVSAMVGAFAVAKIVEFSKSIIDLAGTIKNFVKSPVGAAIAALGLLVSAITIVIEKSDQWNTTARQQKEILKNQQSQLEQSIKSWDDLTAAQKNSINVGMSEIAHLQNLWAELESIVDENGKVKKGYKERASFITSTLAESLGVEMKLNGDVVSGYKKVKKSIDDVIAAKKAKVILDSQEGKYKEAIDNQAQALENMTVAESNYLAKQREYAEAESHLNTLRQTKAKGQNAIAIMGAQARVQALKSERDAAEKNYRDQENIFAEYATAIANYDRNLALYHEKRYDEMSSASWEYIADAENVSDAERIQLEKRKKEIEQHMNQLIKLNKDGNTTMFNDQINADKKQLAEIDAQLRKVTSATEQGLDATERAWARSMSAQVSTLTGKKVEFRSAGEGNVQAYVNGEKFGAPRSVAAMRKMSADSVAAIIAKKPSFTSAGADLANGVAAGINSRSGYVYGVIRGFGNSMLANMKMSLQEKSPSKATAEMGAYLLEGLEVGMNEERNNAIREAAYISKGVLSSIGKGLTDTSSTSNDSPESGYNSMLKAFKQALGEMKIELDDQTAGQFVEKTVSRLVYT